MQPVKTEYILSLSYGKDSLACLRAIEHLGWPLDRIVTADVWATDDIPAAFSAFKKLWKALTKAIGVPPKWIHLAAHAKKARTRKKYRNRIWRYVFEALAAEGGGGP